MTDIDLAPDVLVIGGGIAGAIAAARAKEKGARVVLVKKAGGGSGLSSGAIDIADELFGTIPGGGVEPLERGTRTRKAVDGLAARVPRHPYARVGAAGRERIREAISLIKELARPLDLVERDDGQNHVLATQLGTVKRTGVVQRSQLADLAALEDGAVVGVVQISDLAGYDARPVAHTLAWVCGLGRKNLQIVPVIVGRTRGSDVHHAPIELAQRLDDAAQRTIVIDALRQALRETTRVPSLLLFPPALGLEKPAEVVADFERATAKGARELLATTPSVPGERLSRALAAGLRARGVTVVDGAVSSIAASERRAQRVVVDGARVKLELVPKSIVMAGGRFLGGGIVRDQRASEPLLGLPVVVAGSELADRFVGDLLDARPTGDHALFRAGVAVDERMRPLDLGGGAAFDNVVCAGSLVEGWDPARDGAAGAVAALTGFLAGEQAAAAAKGA